MDIKKTDIATLSNNDIVKFCADPGHKNINSFKKGTRIILLTDNIVVKFGLNVTPEEARNQQYAYCTMQSFDCGLRIPKVYRYFRDSKSSIGYLAMEFIDGSSLMDLIIERPGFELNSHQFERLAMGIHQLATIMTPDFPGPRGGGIPQGYLFSEDGAKTKFRDIESLNSWLNVRARLGEDGPRFKFELSDCIFCHLDLACRNIIVLQDGSFVLLDWANAGFYPKVFETYCLRFIAQNQPHNYSFASSLLGALESISLWKTDKADEDLIFMLNRVFQNNLSYNL
jgi:serine/threonine protein kinase